MAASSTVRITVDGPTTAIVDEQQVPLSQAERVVLAALVVDLSAGVHRRRLFGLLWPEGPPRTARQSLHNIVSRLRGKLGTQILLRGETYRLAAEVRTDADHLRVPIASPAAVEPAWLDDLIDDLPVTPRWFADLPADDHHVRRAAARLDELLVGARWRLLEGLDAAGHRSAAITVAREVRRSDPTDEAAWVREIELLLTAGRRLEAAATYRDARRELPAASGAAPGRRLQAMEARIWGSSQSPSTRRAAVLVGRDEDTREIARLLRGGRTVLVHGPAWSGKSRLAAFVREEWPVRGLHVDCADSRRAALASVQAVVGRDASPAGAHDAHALLGELGRRTAVALSDCALLVLDDVDRLPPFSREVLARALRSSDVRVLATSRRMGVAVPGRDDIAAVGLRGLSADDLGALLSLDPATARAVQRLTGGIPGLALLLADAAEDAGVELRLLDRLADLQVVPPGIADALLGRLAGLSNRARAFVEATATLPDHPADGRLLAQVEMTAPGLVVVDGNGRPRLAHPLLERVVRDQMPPGIQAEAGLLRQLRAAAPQQRSA